eukprot:CAMPEP_0177607048 /NCGR_PEP_ID=MMETSP0419_2-20121207/17684_1 /TAXON_ID=582737 /ORGANISM="Tetraselmis sp., Strain GSL018" /LENGTH=293 /DNA_ID=CAMNT_0019101553 /DNA_START=162 /DNA_END=1043 /DNA_ORIENTATION=+
MSASSKTRISSASELKAQVHDVISKIVENLHEENLQESLQEYMANLRKSVESIGPGLTNSELRAFQDEWRKLAQHPQIISLASSTNDSFKTVFEYLTKQIENIRNDGAEKFENWECCVSSAGAEPQDKGMSEEDSAKQFSFEEFQKASPDEYEDPGCKARISEQNRTTDKYLKAARDSAGEAARQIGRGADKTVSYLQEKYNDFHDTVVTSDLYAKVWDAGSSAVNSTCRQGEKAAAAIQKSKIYDDLSQHSNKNLGAAVEKTSQTLQPFLDVAQNVTRAGVAHAAPVRRRSH